VLLSVLVFFSVRLPLQTSASTAVSGGWATHVPPAFWLFAGFAVLYGIRETMNGNWSQLDITTEHVASATEASIALTAFWAMVTVGRVLFASIGRWVSARVTYHVLPVVLVGTFCAGRRAARWPAVARRRRFRSRWAGLLGPAALNHQFRATRSRRDGRSRSRRRNRVLSGWIRDRRVRRGQSRRPWREPVGDFWLDGRRGWRHGGAVVRGRSTPAFATAATSAGRGASAVGDVSRKETWRR